MDESREQYIKWNKPKPNTARSHLDVKSELVELPVAETILVAPAARGEGIERPRSRIQISIVQDEYILKFTKRVGVPG